MKRLYAIGEVLIDFTPLANENAFQKNAGGAPANVAAVVSLLGGRSTLLSQVGTDNFGSFLIETLKEVGVSTKHLHQTNVGQTSLAFVELDSDGLRDFSFYRNGAADLLYSPSQLPLQDLEQGDAVHFCSVNLVESPMKEAHIRLIEEAHKKDCLVSFDPNVRLPLWGDSQACRETILSFIPCAHILKISDDELEFITGIKDVKEAIHSLFIGHVQVILLTRGANGAELYTQSHYVQIPGVEVFSLDTTGAGDAFIGAFLYKILKEQLTTSSLLSSCEAHATSLLQFANNFAAKSTQHFGAISSYKIITH